MISTNPDSTSPISSLTSTPQTKQRHDLGHLPLPAVTTRRPTCCVTSPHVTCHNFSPTFSVLQHPHQTTNDLDRKSWNARRMHASSLRICNAATYNAGNRKRFISFSYHVQKVIALGFLHLWPMGDSVSPCPVTVYQ